MIVCTRIGSANNLTNREGSEGLLGLEKTNGKQVDKYHHSHIFVVDAIIIYWRFEEVGILFQPITRTSARVP